MATYRNFLVALSFRSRDMLTLNLHESFGGLLWFALHMHAAIPDGRKSKWKWILKELITFRLSESKKKKTTRQLRETDH